jgi:GTPase SAR1 family protein
MRFDPVSSFIARKHELIETKRRLTANRLLLLMGTGGSGKTCLVIHISTDQLASVKDRGSYG